MYETKSKVYDKFHEAKQILGGFAHRAEDLAKREEENKVRREAMFNKEVPISYYFLNQEPSNLQNLSEEQKMELKNHHASIDSIIRNFGAKLPKNHLER